MSIKKQEKINNDKVEGEDKKNIKEKLTIFFQ